MRMIGRMMVAIVLVPPSTTQGEVSVTIYGNLALMEKAAGQQVTLLPTNPATGAETRERATVLVVDGDACSGSASGSGCRATTPVSAGDPRCDPAPGASNIAATAG